MPPPMPANVSLAMVGYSPIAREGVLQLRTLIFDVAQTCDGVGPLEETLKWGQPAYLTTATRSGTTLRLGPHKDAAFGIFAHCQSRVISAYEAAFPGLDRIEGNRAVLFNAPGDIVPERVSHLIRHALTYHLK